MKKSILMAMIMALLVMIAPEYVSAKAPDLSKYESETLKEVFEQEGIDYDFSTSKYSESGNSKIVMYLFRQNGCLNCKNFLNYMKETLLPNYGDRFIVKSFELKDHPINFGLLDTFAAFYNVKATTYTTPLIIVNDKIYQGNLDAEMKKQLEQNLDYNNRFDVMKELDKGITNIGDSAQREFKDKESDVFFSSFDHDLRRKHELKATPIDLSHIKMDGYQYWKAYDIDMYDGDQKLTLNNGTYMICVPKEKPMHADTKVAYIEDNKIKESQLVIGEMYHVCFRTPHLSQYAFYTVGPDNNDSDHGIDNKTENEKNDKADITEDTKKPLNNQKEESEPNPYTMDPLLSYVGLFAIGVMCLFGGMFVYFGKKEQN